MVNCIIQFSSIWRYKILCGWRDWCRNFTPQIIEVRQQCYLNPYLFIIYMNIMEYINVINTHTPSVVWFFFADYVAVCLCTGKGLRKKTDQVKGMLEWNWNVIWKHIKNKSFKKYGKLKRMERWSTYGQKRSYISI